MLTRWIVEERPEVSPATLEPILDKLDAEVHKMGGYPAHIIVNRDRRLFKSTTTLQPTPRGWVLYGPLIDRSQLEKVVRFDMQGAS